MKHLLPPVAFGLLLASLAHAEEPKRISSALQPFVDRHVLAGAVGLVADREKVAALEPIGYADVAARKPMRPDSLFWIASMTKPITATALMILVDEGKLDVDDPVEKYLPEFKGQWLAVERDTEHMLLRKPARPVKIRDLLTHRSGLVHFLELENPSSGTFEILPLREAARLYALTPLQYEPGTRWQYCNAGFNTVGRIIEVITGMPYEVFLDRRIFEPLGMKDTTFSPNQEHLARLAKSYKPGLEETSIPIIKGSPDGGARRPFPAGGLFSTADDLARFCQMLLNDGSYRGRRILSDSAVKRMTSKQLDLTADLAFGLGWLLNSDGSFEHNGAYSTNMLVDPKRGQVRILLMQHASFPGADDGKGIHEAFNKAAVETK